MQQSWVAQKSLTHWTFYLQASLWHVRSQGSKNASSNYSYMYAMKTPYFILAATFIYRRFAGTQHTCCNMNRNKYVCNIYGI